MPEQMTTAVLIHGAWAGGWVWETITPYLKEQGFRRSKAHCYWWGIPGAVPLQPNWQKPFLNESLALPTWRA